MSSAWPIQAKRCRQEAEDGQGEDGEEGAAGKGKVPALV